MILQYTVLFIDDLFFLIVMHPWQKKHLTNFLNLTYMNSSYSSKQQAQQEFKNICPPNSSDTLCLCFCLYPSSMITIFESLLSHILYAALYVRI